MNDVKKSVPTRKEFLKMGGMLLAVSALNAPLGMADQNPSNVGAGGKSTTDTVADVTPPEDLMREHGALSRILFIYDEIRQRLGNGRPFPAEVLVGSAQVIRRFIEDYHEKQEEDSIFPRFEKAGKLTDLVSVLHYQHQVGRKVTQQILTLAKSLTEKSSKDTKLAGQLFTFNRMYRPHKAREDTILFPALRTVVSP